LGHVREAISDFEMLLKLNPNGTPEFAREFLGDIRLVHNDAMAAHFCRGYFHAGTFHLQEAIRDFEKFIELDPNSEAAVKARKHLAELRSSQTKKELEKQKKKELEKWKQEHPEDWKKIEGFWVPFGLIFGAICGGAWFASLDIAADSPVTYGGFWCIWGVHCLLLGMLFFTGGYLESGKGNGWTMGLVGLIMGTIPVALLYLLVGAISITASIVIGTVLGAIVGLGVGGIISDGKGIALSALKNSAPMENK